LFGGRWISIVATWPDSATPMSLYCAIIYPFANVSRALR
jgi:hypothetical protein